MKAIPPRPDLPPAQLESEDLIRLAYLISGKLQIECPRCRILLKPTVVNRELRIASSPDLSALDPRQPSRPRLVFYCTLCQRPAGYLQGDSWTAAAMDAVAEGTRWSHLEMDEGKPEKLIVGEFDLED